MYSVFSCCESVASNSTTPCAVFLHIDNGLHTVLANSEHGSTSYSPRPEGFIGAQIVHGLHRFVARRLNRPSPQSAIHSLTLASVDAERNNDGAPPHVLQSNSLGPSQVSQEVSHALHDAFP